MSQTKAQLISDLVQALNFTGTASAPANGLFLSATNTLQLSTASTPRLTINSDGHVDVVGNLDVGAGIDVTGNITATGTLACGDITSSDGNGNLTLKDNNHTGNNTEHKILFSASDNTELINFISPFGEQHLRLRHGSTELVKFQIDGKVGIGLTNPSALLNLGVDTEANLGSGSEGIRITSGSSNAQFVRLGDSYSNNSVTGPGTLVYSSNKLSLRCDNSNQLLSILVLQLQNVCV